MKMKLAFVLILLIKDAICEPAIPPTNSPP